MTGLRGECSFPRVTQAAAARAARGCCAVFLLLAILLRAETASPQDPEPSPGPDPSIRRGDAVSALPKDCRIVPLPTYVCRWKRADHGYVIDLSGNKIGTLRDWATGISHHVSKVGLIQLRFSASIIATPRWVKRCYFEITPDAGFFHNPIDTNYWIVRDVLQSWTDLLTRQLRILIDGRVLVAKGKINLWDGDAVVHIALPIGQHTLEIESGTQDTASKMRVDCAIETPREVRSIPDYPGATSYLLTRDVDLFIEVFDIDTLQFHRYTLLPGWDELPYDWGMEWVGEGIGDTRMFFEQILEGTEDLAKKYGDRVRLLTPMEYLRVVMIQRKQTK